MFKEEAHWIKTVISRIDFRSPTTVLDVGSSNIEFRTVIQPHIHELIHKPLLEGGFNVCLLDLKKDESVDIVIDLTSNDLPDSLFSKTYDLIICCNILEHVKERDLFMRNMLRFSHHGTFLMITVPLVYPKHNDPIDTMYRPTVKQLTDFIATYAMCKLVKSEELVITEKEYYVLKPGRKLDYLLLRSQRWLLRWYLKPLRWKVTCALFEIQKR
jgi:2-polyprenyl-3-methyl-5-hydroxy-6-metoxy-1,4-benzoquinol methylase